MSVSWSELPRIFFPIIMSHVDSDDILKMATVCRQWRACILAQSTQQSYLTLLEKRFAHLYPKGLMHQNLLSNLKRNIGWASSFKEIDSEKNLEHRREALDRVDSELFNVEVYESDWYEAREQHQIASYDYWTSKAPYKPGAQINPEMDVNAVDYRDGTTALHKFVYEGKVEKCRILLQNGADVEIKTLNGNTPLSLALHHKQYEIILLLLKSGAKGPIDQLSLVEVIDSRQEELAELLIARGVTFREEDGVQPLHAACAIGLRRVAAALVQAGANMDSAFDKSGYSALNHAAFWGHLEIVQLLVEAGADPTISNPNNQTSQEIALIWPGWDNLHKVLGFSKPDTYQYNAPLVKAIAEGNLAYLAKQYFEEGVISNFLDVAATFGQVEVIRFFLKTGVDVNYHNDVRTPLITATRNGRTEAVRLLLEEGADASIPDLHGKTALEYAQQYWSESTELIQLLKGKKRKVQQKREELPMSSLLFALDKKDYKTADLILENPGVLNEQDPFGQTALHIAVYKQDDAALMYLLKKGASYTIQDKAGHTPLDLARLLGNNDIIKQIEIAQIRDGVY